MSAQFLFIVLCYCLAQISKGNILVYRYNSNQFLQEFYSIPAQFGAEIPSNGLNVFGLAASDDPFGCLPLNGPPKHKSIPKARYAVIIQRGANCTFETKVRNAQDAGWDAAIIYNSVNDDNLEPMSAKNATGIDIVSVFVAYSTGINLKSAYANMETRLVINDDLPFNINTQLILPFSILIGLCFLIMIFYMIYKCVREERRLRLHRLPKNMLKKIPITKFTKGQPYEMCVICLDDFTEGERLRVLPCAHAYHSNCIDPWLTKNKRVCPICKRKVFAKGETRASRRRQSSLDSLTDTDDDTTPLLRQGESGIATNNHGTFSGGQDDEEAAGTTAATDGDIMSSDDENVLLTNDSPSHSSTRVNPFDRQPNLPPNLEDMLNSRRSVWDYPIMRLFRRRTPIAISIAAPPMTIRGSSTIPRSRSEPNAPMNVPETSSVAASSGVRVGSQPASNNILNPNLSGSFKDDDEMEAHQSIYEPISTQTPSAAASTSDLMGIVIMGSNSRQTQAEQQSGQQDSVFIQTPSQGGIGVVALPNTNLRSPYVQNRQYFT
ncbi:E3 ubiquitin-protein ligase Godzilla [Episyrphus balteatus]|uniref:E3 ubiquitin-protein ligase Godzilla n=1 Tax=Episyrphus balteatus TaxID=286459 RepID=UPI00248504CA|nr:E3 ubiquitin-protein ligase Godzilla [Episyrphus balteatus]